MSVEVQSLKSLLVPSKSTEVEFPGLEGLKINVSFLSREEAAKIRKKAVKVEYKNRQPVEAFNEDLFLQLYVDHTIKGWSGFKLSYLEQLAPVELGDYAEDSVLAYNSENALFLMKASADFDTFITETVTDLSNFQKASGKK